jgi:hypothetical protein
LCQGLSRARPRCGLFSCRAWQRKAAIDDRRDDQSGHALNDGHRLGCATDRAARLRAANAPRHGGTGIGATLGALFFGNVSAANFAIIEGFAAGAMLTMIAQTMLPEAYVKGGNIVGLATLMGFLIALFFKELG